MSLTMAGEGALVTPHLYPGEEVLHCIRGVERPWAFAPWAFALLSSKRCLIAGTERRLLLIVHRTDVPPEAGAEESFASLAWEELEHAELKGTSLRVLRISAHAGRWCREFRVTPSYKEHEGIVRLWQRKTTR